ncbi:phosphoesterase RecJ domain-containing protein [Anaerosphaera aminiphila DSM 21120]|uniref:Phosphoesterase RecJ domain-containing protein n=1 Tax=Anaerosphaera aminiphila DSM 21120 TaxID=1120995 RepID=A0A1M5NYV9_9FIRM|nr:bifunctional oligoribonuclease/PAP phosphatase NrnA [Anaerosphaera aminiphila]SHG94756.1 phosphoesterase RecJ domain-containing protein [Anaerosphaera aminiphila DSM 21120]
MEIGNLKKIIEDSNKIYIASHVSPDGDNIGSLLAMFKILKNLNKEVYMIMNEDAPDDESFLPNLKYAVKSDDLDSDSDLFITLDCADLNRLGIAKNLFLNSKYTVNIDHHYTNTNYAQLNIVDSKASATGELLYTIFSELNLKLDTEIATCLYTAISSDTGSFKYDSTTSYTFEVASELLKYNIDKREININLYQNKSLEKTKLFLEALNSFELYGNDKIGLVTISDDLIKSIGAKNSDADGIVEFIRDISGIEIAILLKEKSDCIRLSLRTKSYANAINIASKFNGGGHIRAAGATIELPLKDTKKKVVEYSLMELDR